MLTFAALTSTVSLLEVPVSYVVDEYKIKRSLSVWIIAFFIFILGIPSLLSQGEFLFFKNFITYLGSSKPVDFMSFIIHVSNDTLLPLGGFLITFFVAYIWKKENLLDEGNVPKPIKVMVAGIDVSLTKSLTSLEACGPEFIHPPPI